LTRELCEKARWVIGVEVDKNMIDILNETCIDKLNLKIIQKNILGLNIEKVLGKIREYKVVANLPYYITQPVLRYFLENTVPPESMVLMVQKEVAEKICAKPGDMSLLSVSIQFYADPQMIQIVLAKSFFPQPKVDSAIIKLTNIKSKMPDYDIDIFFQIVKAGFSGPRKQLHNSIAGGLRIEIEKAKKLLNLAKIAIDRRAETLSLKEWGSIYGAYTESKGEF
jgi:16S rRNA (adenine1518-N6/adenine1519-N6)-dimethyltransferase